MKNYYKGIILAIISAIGYSIMPILAVNVYKYSVSTFTLLFIRFFISSIILYIYIRFKYKSAVISKKDVLVFFLLGGILYTMQAILHFSSVKYISPSLAILLLFTYPIFVCILSSIINKEKFTKKNWVSIIVSFLGLVLVLGDKFEGINLYGVILSIGAAAVYSIYTVVGDKAVKKQPPIITCAYVVLFATVSIFIIGMLTQNISFDIISKAIPSILAIVFLSTVIADFTFFQSLEYVGSTKVATLGMIEPLFTAIFSYFFLSENLEFIQYLGIAFVLIGCICIVGIKRR